MKTGLLNIPICRVWLILAGLWTGVLATPLQAQTWPRAFSNQFNALHAGGTFTNGGNLFSLEGTGSFQFQGYFTQRNGRVVRYVDIPFFGFGDFMHCQADSAHQRIFISSQALLWQNISVSNFNNSEAFYGSPINRLHSIICLDTSGTQLWSARLFSPADTVIRISMMVADGQGGLFVAGRLAGSVAAADSSSGGLDLNQLLRGGCSFLSRISATGQILWTKTQKDNNASNSPIRATGLQWLRIPRPGQIELVTAHADTAIEAYVRFNVVPKPNVFILEKSRFDANGNVLSQKRGTFSSRYFPFRQLAPGEIRDMKIDGQDRIVVSADMVQNNDLPPRSAVLVFDTAFSFLSGLEIPGLRSDGGIGVAGPNSLAWMGSQFEIDPFNTLTRIHYFRLNLSTGSVETAFTARNECANNYSYIRPTLLTYRDQNPQTNTLLYFKSGNFNGQDGRYSPGIYRFANGTEAPCTRFSPAELPGITPLSTPPTLTWEAGGLPWFSRSTFYWKDTVYAISTSAANFPVQDFCRERSSGLLNSSVVVCGDSLAIRVPLFDQYDITRLNNERVNRDTVIIWNSGQYIFTYRDTCKTSQPINDTLQVTLVDQISVSVFPDTLRLCPNETRMAGASPVPGLSYQWISGFAMQGSDIPFRSFSASEIPIGSYPVILEANVGNSCVARDTLYIENRPGPPLPTLPDTLRLCPGESKTLGATPQPGFRYRWISPFPLSDTANLNRVFSAAEFPLATFRLQLSVIGIGSGICPGSRGLVLQNIPGPRLNLDSDSLRLCAGEKKRTGPTPEPGVQYQWQPADRLLVSTEARPEFDAGRLAEGKNIFVVEARIEGNCPRQDTLVVWRRPEPAGSITERSGDSVLALEPGGFRQLLWQPNGGFVKGSATDNPVSLVWAAYFTGQQVRVDFRDAYQCPGTALYERRQPVLFTPPPLAFPNLVTQNEDGKNDRFEILNLQARDEVRLEIFNRWGKKVFETDRYGNQFPTQDDLEEGVYYYQARARTFRAGKTEEARYQGYFLVVK